MKLIYIICLMMLMSFSAYSITPEDSTKAKPKIEETGKQPGIGHTDSTFQNQKRKRDVFVDKDGDGICDNRVNGMSFEKFRRRYRANANKKDNPEHQGGRK